MTEMAAFSRTPRKSSRDNSQLAFRSRTVSVASTGSSDSSGKHNSLYKTELCRSYEETGNCRYGKKCQFAHSVKEVRVLNRHPKYKTEMCKSFHTNGYCPYGARCHFVHNANDEEMDDLYARGRGRSASSIASNDDNSQIDKSLGALSLKVEEWPLPGNEASSSCSSSEMLHQTPSTNSWSSRMVAKMVSKELSPSASTFSSSFEQFVERSASPPTPWTSAMYSPKRMFNHGSQFGSIGSASASDRDCASSPETNDAKFDTNFEPFAPVEPLRLQLPNFEPISTSCYKTNSSACSSTAPASWFFDEPDGIFQAPRLPVFQNLKDF